MGLSFGFGTVVNNSSPNSSTVEHEELFCLI